MIELKNIHKKFRSVVALEGINFTARDGQVTGLIGPNGAGKTTALRIIYTVMNPDRGNVLVDGFDSVIQSSEVLQKIGVLPDARGLYPRLTAREHIRYYGKLHGLRGQDLESKIEALIETLGMQEIADRRAKGFSKGQVRKVALARALVHNPQNLLLDEPTNGLDLASSKTVHNLIHQMRNQGRCVLFCSHIMHEVASICDRIVVLSKGRVAAAGTVGELRQLTGKTEIEDVFLSLSGDDTSW